MKGLNELRHKESDRIQSILFNLKKVGIEIFEENNNLHIFGKKIKLKKNAKIKSFGDHRIAMSFSILNILYENKLKIDNKKCINISYPDFTKHLNYLYGKAIDAIYEFFRLDSNINNSISKPVFSILNKNSIFKKYSNILSDKGLNL